MKEFANLFSQLDQTNSTNEKLHIMAKFFESTDSETSAWTLYFLSGQKPKKLVGSAKLFEWAQQATGYPRWLMEDCYGAVGDTAEMIALVLGHHGEKSTSVEAGISRELSLGDWMTKRLLPLAYLEDDERRQLVLKWWSELDTKEIFIINKFLTGGLRVGVSETLVYRALERVFQLPRATIAARLLGRWKPTAEFFESLKRPATNADGTKEKFEGMLEASPLPFCLAAPLEGEPAELGDISNWQLEWKWDGIRCQIVKTATQLEIWSRGEENITESFPDLAARMRRLPGEWIMDGELLAGPAREPKLFQELQKRLNRKKPSAAFQKQNAVSYLVYDFLSEGSGEGQIDWAKKPLAERRARLEIILQPFISDDLNLSELLNLKSWEEAAKLRLISRTHGAEGLMIKSKTAPYEVGRKRGIWFKWKVDPFTVDVVLSAAQPGTGRRASLYTDYTFSIWRDDQLVPIAKAYSGLTDLEIRELDQWIRKHTLERFGPVRMLETERVFELGFEGIAESTRNKSGLALRFPRILRERTDKKAADVDRVEDLRRLLNSLSAPVKVDDASGDKSKDQMSFELNPQSNSRSP